MVDSIINPNIFKVKYLPDFARWILTNRLEEFVLVNIRYCREANLPIMKALSRYQEQELVNAGLETTRAPLQLLAENKIAELIEASAARWRENSFGIIDREDIVAEDLTVGFHIQRKTYAYFLDAYTANAVLHRMILEELDVYTTQEELRSYSIFLQIQKEKLDSAARAISERNQMLLATQELAKIGSYLIDYHDQNNSIYTLGYKQIFEFEERIDFQVFLQRIHPEDSSLFKEKVGYCMAHGGELEIEYRYLAPSGEKRIWSRSQITSANGKPVLIKGMVRDVTEQHRLISELKRRETFFEKAQGLNFLGNWSWELETGKVIWSNEMYRIFELDNQVQPNLADFINYVHPDDRERIKIEIQKFESSPAPSEYVFKIVTPKGNTKIIRGMSEVETNSSKIIVRCFGTCQDITTSDIMQRVIAHLQ